MGSTGTLPLAPASFLLRWSACARSIREGVSPAATDAKGGEGTLRGGAAGGGGGAGGIFRLERAGRPVRGKAAPLPHPGARCRVPRRPRCLPSPRRALGGGRAGALVSRRCLRALEERQRGAQRRARRAVARGDGRSLRPTAANCAL